MDGIRGGWGFSVDSILKIERCTIPTRSNKERPIILRTAVR
jgi:hypothetical protein